MYLKNTFSSKKKKRLEVRFPWDYFDQWNKWKWCSLASRQWVPDIKIRDRSSILHPVSTPSPQNLSIIKWWWFYQQNAWVCAKSLQSCPTLFNPMNCRPPDSVYGILQARILEWVAMPSFRASSQSRDRTCISYISCISRQVLYHSCHLGNPDLSSK